MKKLIICLGLLSLIAGPAVAQLGNAPVADTAAPLDQGRFRVSGGWTKFENFNDIGARATYGVLEKLGLWADLSWVMPDGDLKKVAESGMAYGLGAKWSFNLTQLPMDLAIRAAVTQSKLSGKDNWKDTKIFNLIGGLVVSKEVASQFSIYGQLGWNHAKLDGPADDTSDDIAFGGGVLFNVNDQWGIYGEVDYIDDPIFGFGGRYTF